jgi:hypothetical protein
MREQYNNKNESLSLPSSLISSRPNGPRKDAFNFPPQFCDRSHSGISRPRVFSPSKFSPTSNTAVALSPFAADPWDSDGRLLTPPDEPEPLPAATSHTLPKCPKVIDRLAPAEISPPNPDAQPDSFRSAHSMKAFFDRQNKSVKRRNNFTSHVPDPIQADSFPPNQTAADPRRSGRSSKAFFNRQEECVKKHNQFTSHVANSKQSEASPRNQPAADSRRSGRFSKAFFDRQREALEKHKNFTSHVVDSCPKVSVGEPDSEIRQGSVARAALCSDERIQQRKTELDARVKAAEDAETEGFAFRPSFTSSDQKRQRAAEKREQILSRNAERKAELQAKAECEREKEEPAKSRARKVPRFMRKTTEIIGAIPIKPPKVDEEDDPDSD